VVVDRIAPTEASATSGRDQTGLGERETALGVQQRDEEGRHAHKHGSGGLGGDAERQDRPRSARMGEGHAHRDRCSLQVVL